MSIGGNDEYYQEIINQVFNAIANHYRQQLTNDYQQQETGSNSSTEEELEIIELSGDNISDSEC